MNRSHKDQYDIIIIGAGPAGLKAGLTVTETSGLDVLIIDKNTPWEKPIACAEGVGKRGLEESLEVKPSWIRQVIDKATFHSPDNSCITYRDKNKGYIINRGLMQKDICADIYSRGGSFLFGNRAIAIGAFTNGYRQVLLQDGSKVKARVVIDASGPIGLLGRGEEICWKPYDLEPAYFAVTENVAIPTDTVHLHAGGTIAPGGYAWAFPREEGCANIGVVIGSRFKKELNIKELLDNYLKTHYPHAKVVKRFAGAIPCGYRRKTIALPGLFKAGDAASTINPISRAGIAEAFISGGIAANCAIELLNSTDSKSQQSFCREYEKRWYKARGFRHLKMAKVKDSLSAVPDEDYNRAARSLQSLRMEEITMSKIFKISLGRFPRLVWALRHLM